MTKSEKRKFNKFLRKHGAYGKFVRSNECNSSYLYWKNIIEAAFAWEYTKEGHNYWSDLNGLWQHPERYNP